MIHAMRIILLLHDSWRNKFPSSYGLTIGYFWSLVFFFPFSILQTCSIATFLSIKYSVAEVNTSSNLVMISDNASWFYHEENEEKSIALVDIPWRGTSDLIIFLPIAINVDVNTFAHWFLLEHSKWKKIILFRFSYREGIDASSSSSL